jgi:hypothetical protein
MALVDLEKIYGPAGDQSLVPGGVVLTGRVVGVVSRSSR